MNEKYELIQDNCITRSNRTLYRIRALKDFGDVRQGNLGGYVEDEDCLSDKGNCWVYDHAAVYGGSRVMQDAKVKDCATVCNYSYVLDSATISDFAVISDSQIENMAHVHGFAFITQSDIRDCASIGGAVEIFGSNIFDKVRIAIDEEQVISNVMLGGTARIFHPSDYMLLTTHGNSYIFYRDVNGVICWNSGIELTYDEDYLLYPTKATVDYVREYFD